MRARANGVCVFGVAFMCMKKIVDVKQASVALLNEYHHDPLVFDLHVDIQLTNYQN